MVNPIPTTAQTWLICGGRDFKNLEMFDSAMGDLIRLKGMPHKVVQGGAKGADWIGKCWAEKHAIRCYTEYADWDKHGKAAGPMRNQVMLDKYSPDLVIAFPGGKGTADMVTKAHKAGVDVVEIKQGRAEN